MLPGKESRSTRPGAKSPPHGITRDRAGQVARRRLAEAVEEGRLPRSSALVIALVVPLLLRLVDLTHQGTTHAYCGRDYLGRELHEAASASSRTWRGKARDRFSIATVGRVHRILVALDLIRVQWRHDPAADTYLPALRFLSRSLLDELADIARARSTKGRTKAPSPEEVARRQRQSEEAALRAAGGDQPAPEAPTERPDLGAQAERVRGLRGLLEGPAP